MHNATPCQSAGLGDCKGIVIATIQSLLKAGYMTIPTVRSFLYSLSTLAFIVCLNNSRARTLHAIESKIESIIQSIVQSRVQFYTYPQGTEYMEDKEALLVTLIGIMVLH